MAVAFVIALAGTSAGSEPDVDAGARFVRIDPGSASTFRTSLPDTTRSGGSDAISVAARTGLGEGAPVRRKVEHCPDARRGVRFYRSRHAHWTSMRGTPSTAGRQPRSCADARWLASVWERRASIARRAHEAWFAVTYRKWRCIHEHEGAWNANTGNGYFGGLQMTTWFQSTYGPEFVRRWGTADRWPVYAQLIAAERAWSECGCFRQWGTAGRCGLS